MIQSVLIFNQAGVPRLIKFYTPVDTTTQQLLLKQVHSLVSTRSDSQCWFLTPPPLLQHISQLKVIYRHYATLYFVFIVDEQESELGILDLIQVFVQVLNKCFKNVCELDLVMHWEVLQAALEQIVQGGMVIDTNINKIVAAIDEANTQDASTSNITGVNSNLNLNATNALARSTAGFANFNASGFFNRWGSGT